MILFFANNRKSMGYFQKIAGFFPVSSEVYKDRFLAIPDFSALLNPPLEVIKKAVDLKAVEYRILHERPMPVMRHVILRVLARWYYAVDIALIKYRKPEMVVVWNGLMFRRSMFVAAARSLNIKTCFMENGLLPDTTVCDLKGVNARNSVPRAAGFYMDMPGVENTGNSGLVARSGKIPKKTSGKKLPEKFLFIPFQVDTDSQIILFSPWIKTMKQLFDVILSVVAGSDLKVVFKEHPSSNMDYAFLHQDLPENIGIFANEYPTQELIEKAEAVITINSTVGIESLMLGKKVIVLGEAFFDIPGLVLHADNMESLRESIFRVQSWHYDEKLRRNFIGYLRDHYLIKGSWREASAEHCAAVSSRLKGFLNEQ